jgi:hypothetical protein
MTGLTAVSGGAALELLEEGAGGFCELSAANTAPPTNKRTEEKAQIKRPPTIKRLNV